MKNTQVILANRPVGVPGPTHFALREAAVPEPSEGQVLVRITHWSVDPAMRGWANDVPNYSPPVAIGDPMRSFAVGDVIASRHPIIAEGDVVEGLLGWQTHALVDGAAIARKGDGDRPAAHLCARHSRAERDDGLFRADRKLRGEGGGYGRRVLGGGRGRDRPWARSRASSAAATVGIAGGAEKKRQCLEEFGFDAAIDYKGEDVADAVANTAPTASIAISTTPAGRSRTR
jgi:NADPH-dependent curcumin reductase CurA